MRGRRPHVDWLYLGFIPGSMLQWLRRLSCTSRSASLALGMGRPRRPRVAAHFYHFLPVSPKGWSCGSREGLSHQKEVHRPSREPASSSAPTASRWHQGSLLISPCHRSSALKARLLCGEETKALGTVLPPGPLSARALGCIIRWPVRSGFQTCFKVSVNFESCAVQSLKPGCVGTPQFPGGCSGTPEVLRRRSVCEFFRGSSLCRREPCLCEEACSPATHRTTGTGCSCLSSGTVAGAPQSPQGCFLPARPCRVWTSSKHTWLQCWLHGFWQGRPSPYQAVGSQKPPEAPRGPQRPPEAPTGPQRLPEAPTGPQNNVSPDVGEWLQEPEKSASRGCFITVFLN